MNNESYLLINVNNLLINIKTSMNSKLNITNQKSERKFNLIWNI